MSESFLHRVENVRARKAMRDDVAFAPIRDAVNEIAGKALEERGRTSPPIDRLPATATSVHIQLPWSGAMGGTIVLGIEVEAGTFYAACSRELGINIGGESSSVRNNSKAQRFVTADDVLDWLADELAQYNFVDPPEAGPPALG